jgi:hypothetical protein
MATREWQSRVTNIAILGLKCIITHLTVRCVITHLTAHWNVGACMAMNTKHRCHVIIIIDENNNKMVLFNIHVTIPHSIWFSLLLIVRVNFSRTSRRWAAEISGEGFFGIRIHFNEGLVILHFDIFSCCLDNWSNLLGSQLINYLSK